MPNSAPKQETAAKRVARNLANNLPEAGSDELKARSTNADAKTSQTVASRILSRIDELDAKFAALTSEQPVESQSTSSSELAELLARHLAANRNEIAEKNESLMSTVHEALKRQNEAMTTMASSIQELQKSLSNQLQQTPETKAASARDLIAERLDNPGRPPAAEDNAPAAPSTWEQIRSAYIKDTGDKSGSDNGKSASNSDLPAEILQAKAAELDEDFAIYDDYTPPDTTQLNEEQLRSAFLDQERVIATMVGQLQRKFRSRQTLNATQLRELKDSLPEETAARVDLSLQAFDQQVRLGELELSLERARVSRQLSHLEETRRKLELNARVMGLTLNADGQIEGRADAEKQTGSKGRRWLGVMGFGN